MTCIKRGTKSISTTTLLPLNILTAREREIYGDPTVTHCHHETVFTISSWDSKQVMKNTDSLVRGQWWSDIWWDIGGQLASACLNSEDMQWAMPHLLHWQCSWLCNVPDGSLHVHKCWSKQYLISYFDKVAESAKFPFGSLYVYNCWS